MRIYIHIVLFTTFILYFVNSLLSSWKALIGFYSAIFNVTNCDVDDDDYDDDVMIVVVCILLSCD